MKKLHNKVKIKLSHILNYTRGKLRSFKQRIISIRVPKLSTRKLKNIDLKHYLYKKRKAIFLSSLLVLISILLIFASFKLIINSSPGSILYFPKRIVETRLISSADPQAQLNNEVTRLQSLTKSYKNLESHDSSCIKTVLFRSEIEQNVLLLTNVFIDNPSIIYNNQLESIIDSIDNTKAYNHCGINIASNSFNLSIMYISEMNENLKTDTSNYLSDQTSLMIERLEKSRTSLSDSTLPNLGQKEINDINDLLVSAQVSLNFSQIDTEEENEIKPNTIISIYNISRYLNIVDRLISKEDVDDNSIYVDINWICRIKDSRGDPCDFQSIESRLNSALFQRDLVQRIVQENLIVEDLLKSLVLVEKLD